MEVPPTWGWCGEKETDSLMVWLTPNIHRQLPVPVAYLEFLDLVFTGSIWALMTETEAFSGISGWGREDGREDKPPFSCILRVSYIWFLCFFCQCAWYGLFYAVYLPVSTKYQMLSPLPPSYICEKCLRQVKHQQEKRCTPFIWLLIIRH